MESSTNNSGEIHNPNNFLTIDKKYSLTEERYEGIKLFREKFFASDDEDARTCLFLSPEVADSWNRSRKLGINHRKIEYKKYLEPDAYSKIVNDNSHLINIANPIFTAFRELQAFNGSALFLYHVSGVPLLHQTEKTYNPIPMNYIYDESTIGTCTHALATYHNCPIQMLGLEFYCDDFAKLDLIVSAAPIHDDTGKVIGGIMLRQDIPNPPWEESCRNLFLHTFALTYAMATTIENGLKLRTSYDFLETTRDNLAFSYETLKATWSLIDEGLIVIDQTGKINHINKEGCRILNIMSDEKKNKNIKDFLTKQSPLLQLALKGQNVDIEETICTGDDEKKYLISIRPISNQSNNKTRSAVLRLTSIEKFDALVTKRSGTSASYRFKDIIGESKIFVSALEAARRFSSSQENILLSGESGTGKELFAQSIHNNYRPQGPFIAVNCAAIPRNLIESELLGYEGGSFTGADRSGRPGKIELANGGTFFLDEIGDMPMELQGVLLRVLEDKKIMRLGGRRYNHVDFKLVAATNKDLYQMAKNGLFREDLYYRLSVLTIKIPALRERGNDLEVLIRYFIESYCRKIGRAIPQLSPASLKLIKEHKWPGNVRQLENAMIYAVNVTTGNVINPDNLPEYIDKSAITLTKPAEKMSPIVSLKDSEKELIKSAIAEAKYDVATAAQMLNISTPTMYRKLKIFGIENKRIWTAKSKTNT